MNETGLRLWPSPSGPSNGLLEHACRPIDATSGLAVIDWISAVTNEEDACQITFYMIGARWRRPYQGYSGPWSSYRPRKIGEGCLFS